MSCKEEEPGRQEEQLVQQGIVCPSCGHTIMRRGDDKVNIALESLPGLPAGVKFDPSDQEVVDHLESKVLGDSAKLHPLLHNFIPMIEGDEGICYTHPENLPGVSMDGLARHFFHYPSKAYTTGTRKRRKVQTVEQGGETRWHKTGKTRPIVVGGETKGHKKILVLYTNHGGLKQKPEKTNWVMHQYHLGSQEEEKEGELVLSKVFYQTQPRQCTGIAHRQFPPPAAYSIVHTNRPPPPDGFMEHYSYNPILKHTSTQ